ncbi:hypothetical protein D3Z50_00990 [Clostridiaceae bacterium]|nr:hypothetical protein [Clostridiaceae bacterium]
MTQNKDAKQAQAGLRDRFSDIGEEDEALYNLDICSATDCTGLIPAMPQSANEISSYEELYHFLPRAKD